MGKIRRRSARAGSRASQEGGDDGSLNHITHELIVHTSPTKRSSDFVAHLEQIDALYGPMPGRVSKPVVLVEDNGPIHVSKLSRAALAARAH
jgi:hypothetical protein